MALKYLTAEQAALLIKHDDNLGIGGFTPTGSPKVVPVALAKIAEEEHAKGNEFQIKLIGSASTSNISEGSLARAKAIKYRIPYQGNRDIREQINRGEVDYCETHLSTLAQDVRRGFFGDVDVVIVEACDVHDDGTIVPTCGVGMVLTLCQVAKLVIVELNSWHPKELRGIHDLRELDDFPNRKPIPIENVLDRIGEDCIKVDPTKVIVVHTNVPNEDMKFTPVDNVTTEIGTKVADFLIGKWEEGCIPKEFLPIQLGVGNITNAVLVALGKHERVPRFSLYTEIIQDTIIRMMMEGRIESASSSGLSVGNELTKYIYDNLEFFKERIVLRPTEYSNNPEIIHRLGLITINTALEVDIFGNVNSSHVAGNQVVNGIGGSADFARSGFISIFVTPSTAKNGAVSCVVPMVSHHDHTEHSIDVIVTEYGVADLRGLSPHQRMEVVIEKCAHPDYRPLLRKYISTCTQGHIPMNLRNAFSFHNAYLDTGSMKNAQFV